MNSELICECCYTQAVEMSRRDVKWVDCFKEMDAIKVKIALFTYACRFYNHSNPIKLIKYRLIRLKLLKLLMLDNRYL